ncbi:uncharacterized protein BO88DRAFT_351344 [Aspergillus vadensis CBS 113365]|uniref:Uncharacterized protein n=1 Tax=Aspergillus vadensis (strain CBS 113365 / IMI 142717 / IBT 24658) TaxID=1448311 RepID=A0A319AV74_ASPVC|nr:hypothetical protein BO88DRAFT_351344 [Aspergillus vadensis CBS 113365]PYH64267.1 hypothetical protein BO88DRAFT_351344 [Aspergillus vadensis CBS 113365]
MNDTPEIYPLGRDKAESSRICLVEARDSLNTKRFSPDRCFHGFDISSTQFHLSLPAGIGFSVQDILNSFPVEHHNRYDLVYVKMLVTAIKNTEYRDAVKIQLTMLSITRWLRSIGLSSTALPSQISKDSQNPSSAIIVSSWLRFFQLNGVSESAPSIIEDAYDDSGLVDIVNTSFSLDGRGEDLKAKAQKWQMQAFLADTETIMLEIGLEGDSEEAQQRAEEANRNLGTHFAEGGVVGFCFGSVVGRKMVSYALIKDILGHLTLEPAGSRAVRVALMVLFRHQ